MTDLERFLELMRDFGVNHSVLTNRIIDVAGVLWVFDANGDFQYTEDPDGIKRSLPTLRSDISIH